MSDPNLDLVNRMIEEIQNKQNLDLVDELFAEHFVNHSAIPGVSNDRLGMRELFAMTQAAFPDGSLSVNDQVSSGDKVWTWKTFTGTHTGPFRNIAPTGNKVTYDVFDILRIQRGRIVEHWSLVDRLSLLRAIGAV